MAENTVELSEERLAALEAVLDREQTINQTLREQLQWNAMLAGEDIGWARIFGGGVDRYIGPSLLEMKTWSRKLRDALGNVHMQRGLRLRTNNIWSGGIHYDEDALPSGSGHKVQTKTRIYDPINQRHFFGAGAHFERESALYTDGLYLALGDPSTWTLEPWSIEHVGSIAYHPRRPDEIIAYRLDFQDYTNDTDGVWNREWHYVDLYYDMRDKPGFQFKIQNDEKAPDNRVIFDLHVNTQVGWTFGVPDSLTAYAWAKVYRDFVMNGKVMSDAMAQFAFQVATGTKKETANVAARLAEPSDAGATLVGANSLVPLPTAGKGYDFDSGRGLLAIVAAALEVSVVALSSDSGAAGSSYGAASTLDLPTRLAMESRRQLHVDFDRRVLVWLNAPADIDVTFTALDDKADVYRELQALILALDSGLYEAAPIEERISDLLQITGNSVPDGWLIPNNLQSAKAQAALAPKPNPADPNGAPAPAGVGKKSTAAPDQGKNNAAGKSDVKGNDLRTDKVSK